MSDRPTHWEWIAAARAIREGRTEPPADGSLSAELAAELGSHRGGDPINDRADEAAQWREQIMHSFELMARYVKPRFQGSLVNLAASEADAERKAQMVRLAREGAVSQARERYESAHSETPAPRS